jgi:hypothetical protein
MSIFGQRNRTRLLQALLQKRHRECAIFNADTHELRWVSAHEAELNTMLPPNYLAARYHRTKTYRLDPLLELAVRRDPHLVSIRHQAFRQRNVGLHVPSRTNRQAGKVQAPLGLERQESRRRGCEHQRG